VADSEPKWDARYPTWAELRDHMVERHGQPAAWVDFITSDDTGQNRRARVERGHVALHARAPEVNSRG